MAGTRRRRAALLAVLALFLGGEMVLAPFYPRLFRETFGITDPDATAGYVISCRLAALLALPLWGLAARRVPVARLVVCGLLAAAVPTAALALVTDYRAFTALSALAAAAEVAMLLAYPALVGSHDPGGADPGGPDPGGSSPAALLPVRSFAVLFHATAAISALAGAAILALPHPRYGLAAFSVVLVGLALTCHRLLGEVRRPPPVRESGHGRDRDSDHAPAHGQGRAPVRAVAAVALLAAVFEVAAGVVRPFFTDYAAATTGHDLAAGALLFALPHLVALPVLAATRQAWGLLGGRLLPSALALAAAGLALQALDDGLGALVLGRVVFGIGLGLGQVALDVRMFAATGTTGATYPAVEAVRYVALLTAPALASAAVGHGLALPLVLGAAGFALAAALSVKPSPRTGEPCPSPVTLPPVTPSRSPAPAPVPVPPVPVTTSTSGPIAARKSSPT